MSAIEELKERIDVCKASLDSVFGHCVFMELATAEAILAKLEQERWIPAEEGLPEKGKYIEIYRPEAHIIAALPAHDSIDFKNIYTHWRYAILPEPKKAMENKK